MHVSISRRHRAVITLATVLGLLAMPLGVSAHGGYHPKPAFTVTASPEAVSVGQSIAFEVFIRSDGSDAFDKVRLEGSAPGATLLSSPSGCSGSGSSVSCQFGKLKSGHTMSLRFAFLTPASAGTTTFTAKLLEESHHHGWWWHHGKSGSSTKVAFSAKDSAERIDSPDFFASWQPAHEAPVSFATEPIGGDNGQTSRLEVPPVGVDYPATLAENDEPIMCGGEDVGGFGQAVDMSVANGATVSPHLTLTLTYTKHEVGYRSPYHIRFVHQTDDGHCEFPPRGCNKHNDGFCFDAWWSGYGWGKKLVIRVELPSNGRGKGL